MSQPLNIERRVAGPPQPIRFKEGHPAGNHQVFSNPPQVVESVSYGRVGERVNERSTSKILDNLAGQLVPERKSDSLVTSSPSDNRLQQERVISQTYAIKEESDYPSHRAPEVKRTESNWQTYNKQGDDVHDLSLKGRAIQSFNDEDKGLSNKYSVTDNTYTGTAFETKHDNNFETRYDSSKFDTKH